VAVVSDLGIVIIGRNEGTRLVRCLDSIGRGSYIVYVDSGSTDGSVQAALDHGAKVVQLDTAISFTAARARNAGRAALPSECIFAQFIDGDCALQPLWLDAARGALDANDGLAAVFGRRREIAPGASTYNWLCDQEWAVSPGPARYFGGDVMLRLSALDQAGGYPDDMIAGEEPDLAIRMRTRGWGLLCLQMEMTSHDAAILRFGQWWRRTQRSGHACAELAARNRRSPLQDYSRRLSAILFWGAGIPLLTMALFLAGAASGLRGLWVAAGLVLALPLLQCGRLAARETRRRLPKEGVTIATFLMLAKPAQAIGAARYWRGRLGGRRSAIIEYKETAA